MIVTEEQAKTKWCPGRAGQRITFHDLRHVSASLMIAAGADVFDVAQVLGITVATAQRRYIHVFLERKKRAVDRITLSGR